MLRLAEPVLVGQPHHAQQIAGPAPSEPWRKRRQRSTLAYQNSASRRPRRHIVAGCDAESLGQVARSALLLPLRLERGGGTPFRVQQRASALQTPAPACGSAHLACSPSLSRSPVANAVEASATRSVIDRLSPTTSGSSRSTRVTRRWTSLSSWESLGQSHFWSDASDCARAGGERGEDAHFAARADTPGSMTRQLAVQRAPADCTPKGVLAQGESPTPRCSQHSPPFRSRGRGRMRDQTCKQIVKRRYGCWPISEACKLGRRIRRRQFSREHWAYSSLAPQGRHALRCLAGRRAGDRHSTQVGRARARVRTCRYLWIDGATRSACTAAVFNHLRAEA